MVPDRLLGATAAALQRPTLLLTSSNSLGQHHIQGISVRLHLCSSIFLFYFFFPSPHPRLLHQIFLAAPFQLSKLHATSDHRPTELQLAQRFCSVSDGHPQQPYVTRMVTAKGLLGYNSPPALLQAQLTNEGYYTLSKGYMLSVSYLIRLLAA